MLYSMGVSDTGSPSTVTALAASSSSIVPMTSRSGRSAIAPSRV